MFTDAIEDAQLSCDLKTAVDGQDMMDQLHRAANDELPDLIPLDLNMPRKDGRKALEEVKADKRLCSIPIIVLTTSKIDEDIIKSYTGGTSSYMPKPVTFDALQRKITLLTDHRI